MILLLTLLCFGIFFFVLRKYLLKDFMKFILQQTTSGLPNSFVDLGEYTVTIVFVLGLSFLGVLFYKFSTAFFAYLISGDLVSFFIILRGVFSVEREMQNPFTWQHIFSLIVSPPLQFATFYLIYRSIRTFMFYINRTYRNAYSESDVLYFGFVASIGFIFFEIMFFSQSISFFSGVAHFSYLALSKLTAILYYLAVAHIQLLKNEQYKTNLPTYVQLGKYETKIIFSPVRVIFITYLLGFALCFPFYSGAQFLPNYIIVVIILISFLIILLFVLKIFLSGGFNYLGVVMLAESPAHLTENEKMFEAKTGKRILFFVAAIALFFAVLKLKLFFTVIILFTFAIVIYIIAHAFFYFSGFGISFLRAWIKKYQPPEISGAEIGKYLWASMKAAGQSVIPMFAFVFCVFVLFSFFPKKFNYRNKDYVHSVFDATGNPMYVEHIDGNGCVPVSHAQIPDFFFKCLYAQEDRCFTRQGNFFPADFPKTSNWHGISFAVFYRFFFGGGGSNLNMQLIKNSANVISQDVQRKFAESLAVYQLSVQTSDTAIITAYLNEVSMTGGMNQSGVMQGSLYTFGLPISELNPLEIMYMVATLKRNSTFRTKNDRIVNYIDAVAYKEEIAETLLDQAKSWQKQGLITKREYNSLFGQELRFTNKKYKTICTVTTNQFFLKQMKDLKTQGLTYVTSITYANQHRVATAVKKFETKFKNVKRVNGCDLYSAALVVDVKTGNVIGHYGGEGVTDLTQFAGGNMIGSVIKPFVLLEMLEAGLQYGDIKLYDGRINNRYTPGNAGRPFSNTYMGIDKILGLSPNAPMRNIDRLISPIPLFENVEKHFRDMGIAKNDSLRIDEINYPIGSRSMTLFEIAQAYQTLFNRGQYLQLSVFPSTYNPLTENTEKFNQRGQQVYSQENADLIVQALTNAMKDGGTGTPFKNLLPQGITFYAKTGTSDGARHGYTVLSDGNTLVVSYVSYGRIENEHLSLGVMPIPFESGGKSAGVLSALIYYELQRNGKD